jgi:AbiV family abortive infection protein
MLPTMITAFQEGFPRFMKEANRSVATEALIAGMIVCRINARELLEEADILAEKGRNARAYFLMQTACEELGKFAMLEIGARGLLNGRPPKWKLFWKRFRSHDSKSAQLEVQLQWLASRGGSISAKDAEDFTDLAQTVFARGLEVRNATLYVDESHEGSFRKPSDIDFSVPLGGMRALTAYALAATYQRGEDLPAIEAHLRVGPDDEDHRTATELFIRALERARDAGVEPDRMREIIEKQYK